MPRAANTPVFFPLPPPARFSARLIAPEAFSMSRVVCRTWRLTRSYCWRILSRFCSACRQSASAALRSASVASSPSSSNAFFARLASCVAPDRSMRICTRVAFRRSSSPWRAVISLLKLVTEFFIPTMAEDKLSFTLIAILASVPTHSPSSLRRS